MKKRTWGILLTLTMALSLISAIGFTAMAAPEDHPGGFSHEGATQISNETQLTDLFSNGGSGYLASDITLSETAEVAQGKTVSLCLNDHTITMAAGKDGSLIKIDQATLSIYDCGNTVRYFTDSKCSHGVAIGAACEDCGETAVKDGCFETLETSFDISGKTLGTDYIKTEGGVLYGGKASSDGGAISPFGSTTLAVNGVNIVGNSAAGNGGAIDASILTVTNCIIEGNRSAGAGGAIACDVLSVEGSKLSYNTAKTSGGAVYSIATNPAPISQTEFVGNRVVNKDASGGAAGGALSVSSKAVTMTDCKICDNYVYSANEAAQFAAMEVGALTLKDSEVSGNKAEGKTAFAVVQIGTTIIDEADALIEGSTISNNKLIGSESAETLVVFCKNAYRIKNSALTNNTAVCSGDAAAMAGLKIADYSESTLALEGNLVFSGNTFCDINTITPIDVTKLSSVKDADGNATKIAYYSKYGITEDYDLTVTTVATGDLSGFFTAVNPEAYIVNKTVEGGYEVHLASRVQEQPTQDNGPTFKLYTTDLKASDVAYRWYKTSGPFLKQEDGVITLDQGCTWDGSIVNGFFAMRGFIVSITTEESSLYVYSVDGGNLNFTTGTAEAVQGRTGVYKVTPSSKKIMISASRVRFSETLITESQVEDNTSATLNAPSIGDYRCVATVKGAEIVSSYVTVNHAHTWTYSLKSGTSDTIEASCTSGGTCNYTGTDKTLTISKPALTTYGGSESAEATLSSTSLAGQKSLPTIKYAKKNSGGAYVDLEAAPTAAGSYKASFTVGSGVDAKTAYVEYAIAPKAVVVTAEDKSMKLGEALPELTAKVEGLVGSDTVDYTFNKIDVTAVGVYGIVPTGDAEQGNYAVSYVNGTLTVSAAEDPQPQPTPTPVTPVPDTGDDAPFTIVVLFVLVMFGAAGAALAARRRRSE